MPSKDPLKRMRDILSNIDAAREFVVGESYEEFVGDRKTVYAVTRALEIISEASRRLPPEIREEMPEINWKAIMGAGNVYRHDYDEVDELLIWEVFSTKLTPLRAALLAVMERSSKD